MSVNSQADLNHRPGASESIRRMMTVVFVFLAIIYSHSRAQDTTGIPDEPIIYAVEIIGNRVTSDKLILREMKLKPGMTATPKALEKDRLNIESLGLFNRVVVELAEDEGRAVVQVTVTEPFYIYPFLTGRYDVNRPERAVLGVGIYHCNFNGLGRRFKASVWSGYARGFYIDHDDAWFSIGGGYGLDGRIYYNDDVVKDPYDKEVRRRSSGIGLTVKRRLGRRHSLGFNLGWEVISSSSDYYTLTPGGRDRVLSLAIIYADDKRDYRYYPTSGYYITLNAEASRLVDFNRYFYREMAEVRGYVPFDPLILALRGWGEFGQHTLPYYRWLAVGRDLVRAGDGFSNPKGMVLGGSLELRFRLVKPFYLSFDKVPVAGPYLRGLKFSLEGVVFGDRGFYASHRSGFRNDFRAWGFGVQAQLPYIKTAHLLVGWTPDLELNRPSITVKNGVTF
ncbi:MAG TPA: hypothetical protein ENL08_00820 [Bacteroidetes bacterium]|nr:hypothetical protein [Bacteroidota bacterium]